MNKWRLFLILLIFIILINLSCLCCKGQFVVNYTSTDYGGVRKWYELIKVDRRTNFVEVWTKIEFEFIRIPPGGYYGMILEFPYSIEDFRMYPQNDPNVSIYLHYKLCNNKLKIFISNLVIKKYRRYQLCFYYKCSKG